MPSGPHLLNDDGTASIATTLMMSHHAFRRDVARFGVALRRLEGGDHSKVEAVKEEWQGFHPKLHGHHEAEDNGIFPNLRTAAAALTPVIDQLSADHRRIDPLLAEGDRAFAELPASVAAASSVIAQLAALLEPHLATEEAQIIPHLRDWKTFPEPANETELGFFVDGFAWACHGIAPEVVERVLTLLPAPLVARLPAARAAFDARCARVWGVSNPGASRTPIPDWLPGG